MMNREIPSPLYRSTATEMTPRDNKIMRYPPSITKSTSPLLIQRPNVRYVSLFLPS